MTGATVPQGQAHSGMHGLGACYRAAVGTMGRMVRVQGCKAGVMLREQ